MSAPPGPLRPLPAAGDDLTTLLAGRLTPSQREVLERAAGTAREQGVRCALVGGPVRDLLLGRPVLDLDLVVEGDAAAFATALAGRDGPRPRVHERFGTATLPWSDPPGPVDVAGARTEVYPRPGGLPEVTPATLEEDLRRRDVTVNALAVELGTGEGGREWARLLDVVGGLGDLAAGRLRILHPGSFRDDPTRVLRVLRYAARLAFSLDEETAGRLREAVAEGALETVSAPRLAREVGRQLDESDPVPGIRRLAGEGVLEAVFGPGYLPPADPDTGWARLDEARSWYRERAAARLGPDPGPRPPGWLLLTISLAPDRRREVLTRFRPGSADLAAVGELAGRTRTLRHLLERPYHGSDSALYEALGGLGPTALIHLLSLTSGPTPRRRLEHWLDDLLEVVPWVDGHDLEALGVAPGPRRGEILERLFHAQLDGRLVDRGAALAEARRLASEAAAEGG